MIVFLDIGSTLIDGPPAGPARRLAQALGLDGEAAAALEELLFRTPSCDGRDLGTRVSERFGVDCDAAVAAAEELWEAQLREAFVLPGAREAVGALKDAGISRAYLSNIWPPFYACFEREFPDEAGACSQFLSFRTGLMKPDPRAFRQALAALNARAEDAVMVGDTYDNDVAPALVLGMRAVWILHRPHKETAALVRVLTREAPEPDLTLATIGQLRPERLEKLAGRPRNPQ